MIKRIFNWLDDRLISLAGRGVARAYWSTGLTPTEQRHVILIVAFVCLSATGIANLQKSYTSGDIIAGILGLVMVIIGPLFAVRFVIFFRSLSTVWNDESHREEVSRALVSKHFYWPVRIVLPILVFISAATFAARVSEGQNPLPDLFILPCFVIYAMLVFMEAAPPPEPDHADGLQSANPNSGA